MRFFRNIIFSVFLFWVYISFSNYMATAATVNPTISVSPASNSDIEDSDTVMITVSTYGNIGTDQIVYKWDKSEEITVKNMNAVRISVPQTSGTHTLYVRAVDKDHYVSTGDTDQWNKFIYNINSSGTAYEKPEKDPPSISATPSRGNILRGKEIKVKVTDANKITDVRYAWDSEEEKNISLSNNYFKVKAPKTNGSHKLIVFAKDEYKNSIRKTFNYSVVEWVNIVDNGDLNENFNSLGVEIRNANEKNKFALNEEFTYYIDVYNGTRYEADLFVVTFNVPNGFKVVSADNCSQYTNTEITYNIKNFPSEETARYVVVLKCTDLFRKAEKQVEFTATLTRYNSVQSKSTFLSLFYNPSESSKHTKYMFDIEGRKFLPNQGITRAEFAILISNALSLNGVGSNPFSDIDSETYGYTSIIAANKAGLINGYKDGTFRPENVITRAEVASIFAKKLGLNNTTPIWKYFSDIDRHWAQNSMEQLARYGILEGYGNGIAKPNETITRAEAVTMINRLTFRGPLEINKSTYSDVSTTHWAHGDIEEASRTHTYEIDDTEGFEVIAY